MNTSAIDILKMLLENTAAESLAVFSYQASRSVQSRVNMESSDTNALFEKALQIKLISGIPFWDSLMLSTFTIPEFDKNVFMEALDHNENDYFTTLNQDTIHSFTTQLNYLEANLAVASAVKTQNDVEMHICMIDFHIPFSLTSTYLVRRLLQTLKNPGYLLCSGKSYHFYGKNLMPQNEYLEFLTKLILLSPIVDKNWIVHQLLRKQSFLRITRKYDHFPFLVEMID